MQNSILIAQESSQYLGFKKMYRNKIDFLAFCVKKCSAKTLFVYKWRLQRLPSSKDNLNILYTQKAKKSRDIFIFKNPEIEEKERQFPFRFYIQKSRHFTICNL